jgi:sec-independent protein translocase protein TatA
MGIESPVHLLFIAIVALLVLGPKRLPDMAKALGQGIREFRGSLEAGASGASEQPLTPPPPPAAPAVEPIPPAATATAAPEAEPPQQPPPQARDASDAQAPGA